MTCLHVMGVPTGECPGLQERDVCAMKGGQLACQLPQPTCYNATWQLENLARGQPAFSILSCRPSLKAAIDDYYG